MPKNIVLSAASAFIVWGLWGYYANIHLKESQAILAGFVQACISGLATCLIAQAILKTQTLKTDLNFKLYMAPTIVIVCYAFVLIILHWAAQTPNILGTISLPMLVVIPYSYWIAKNETK